MEVSPFNPLIVFAWGTTPKHAIDKAASYFAKTFGVDRLELTAKPTGLSEPSKYRDEAVTVNVFEQSQRVREDTPSKIRYLVKRKG